jgi:putative chitinase
MNIQLLAGLIPANVLAELTPQFLKAAYIDGPKRLSHFLGQCKHESGNFTRFSENLNYSATRLLVVFPKYFGIKTSGEYAYKPEMIANVVYANRYGNGDATSGDGWKYRGRGPIQITFKDNYAAFEAWSGLPVVDNPGMLEDLNCGLLSAAWFFADKHLMVIADQGVDDATIEKITRRINGGVAGLEERAKFTKEIYKRLTSA